MSLVPTLVCDEVGPPSLYESIPILVVDDDEQVRGLLKNALSRWGCKITEAENGVEALSILSSQPRQLVLSDVNMPCMDGWDLLSHMGKKFPNSSTILLSSMADEEILDRAVGQGAMGYLQKPFRMTELKSQITAALLRMSALATNSRPHLDALLAPPGDDAAHDLIRFFIRSSDMYHIETGAHLRRIARFSKLLAELASYPEDFCVMLAEASILHDIGKLVIPEAILKKPGKLTPEEYEIIKTHPAMGAQILSSATDPMIKMAHTVALYHHERWDGTGYPEQLLGEEIPIEARFVAIVDVYDALTEKRVYKEAWPAEKVFEFFSKESGCAFDPQLLQVFLQNFSRFEEMRLQNQADLDEWL